METATKPFPLGQTIITSNALDTLDMDDVAAALRRHERGDWGDICREDEELNDHALLTGGRLYSRYSARNGLNFWIITEADRSATTVLMPEDY